jgi:imidazolonepropionase-like amidohydrolase
MIRVQPQARSSVIGAIVTVASLAVDAQAPAPRLSRPAPPLALVGGTLIDGRGGPVVRDSVVLMRDGRIETVGAVAATPVPAGYQRISAEGMTVLPGLWDLHTHLQYSAHTDLGAWNARYLPQMETVIMPAIARQLLMAGITSARDAMAPLDPVLRVRDRIARGDIPGPTMYVAGALLEHAPPAGLDSFRWGVAGPADARAKVNRLADTGVNLIKLLCVPDLAQEEATAIVEQAHARGLKVAAHGRTDDEIRKCLAAGVDDFQHLGIQAVLPDDIVTAIRERVRQRPLYWTPTVGNPINNRYLKDDAEMLDDAAWEAGLPPAIVRDVRDSLTQLPAMLSRPGSVLADVAMYRRKFYQLKEAGVELLVGTDSGNPGHFHPYATWLELDAWVNHFGVPAMEAIQRATAGAARMMGADKDYGTLEPGKYADVIVVAGDPLRHIDVLRRPVVVIKHGQRVQ